MDALPALQITIYLFIGLIGMVANTGTIYILKLTKSLGGDTGIDPTTLNLMVEDCLCGLILNCVTTPLRLWNTFAGHSWFFSDYSVGCWIHATCLSVCYVTAWLLFGIAVTRVVAVFRPCKYKKWLGLQTVQWLLYVVPWILGYSTHIIFSFILPWYKPATDPIAGGLCVLAPVSGATQALKKYYSFSVILVVFQLGLPLILSALFYSAILLRLLLGFRRRRHAVSLAAAALPSSGVAIAAATKVVFWSSFGQKNINVEGLELQSKATSNTSTYVSRKQRHAIKDRLNDTRQLRSVKVLALASLLIFCGVSPRIIIFGLQLAPRTPWLLLLLETLLFLSTCAGPIVYLFTLADMREAWQKLLRKVLPCVYPG